MAARILFVHGMFLTGRSWSAWADHFGRLGFECVAPSWPGRDGDPEKLRQEPDPRLDTLTLSDVIALYEAEAKRSEDTILIGHSMGGLVVQSLLSRGVGKLGVAIDSAPPYGVKSFAISHLRANAPVLWPGRSAIVPTLASWRYAFWHTGADEEVARAFEAEVVPESRLVGRGPLGEEGRIDFDAARRPLLMIAGELDKIIPASLNRKNAERYGAAAPTELIEMPGRTHYLCGQPGWEDVAETCLRFLEKHA